MDSDFQQISFPITSNGVYYRFFRLIQTGVNSKQMNGWENVLVASGFDIYGDLKYVSVSDQQTDDDHTSESEDDDYGNLF